MDLNLPPVAVVISLLALWVSYTNYRRSNFAVLRLVNSAVYFSKMAGVNPDKLFAHFEFTIRNLGIPLHNLRVHVFFRNTSGTGKVLWELNSMHEKFRDGQFAKGMMATFWLRTYDIDASDFKILKSVNSQEASLVLSADGFEVWEYRLNSLPSRLRGYWNRFARKVNNLYPRRAEEERDVFLPRNWLPEFDRIEDNWDIFLTGLSRADANQKNGNSLSSSPPQRAAAQDR